MKLKFKSLQGSTFTVDAESSDSIATVKGKIESQQGFQVSQQKIIYSGKILTDADTVQSCGVSEKDFLVLMVSKPKAAKPAASSSAAASAPAEAAPAATPASAPDASATATAPAPQAAATSAAPTEAASTVPAAAPAESGPPGSSQFLTGSALEQAVNNIVEMGFEKSEVQKAMRASFNNPERAVEYLMTGIPEHLSQPQAPAAPAPGAGAGAGTGAAQQESAAPTATPAQPAAPPAATTNPRSGNLFEAAAAQAQGGGGRAGGAGRGGAGGDSLAALRDLGEDDGSGNTALDLGNPAMIGQLRQLVQQNPAALAPLVQALAQSNPQLANAMADDPEAVLNLLANNAVGGEEGDEGVNLPSIGDLGQEDRTAVEQIIAMGIEENKAIEVYLMCGRNVEMAIQYYFDNPQDFED
ncbi:UV excision repair protein Rad23 [Meira miltonrushii]|uniref:UV excision repair protein RAD23 n=1 Tax=Meira miltonrushii TaxID=1280837 RepID=A0A316V858_9BASI|nr:UV excision repair protein Rad23 [Meira miltonrushii]PWN33394.1 UV excision repair protein Rad23 [Meira miltonrushii]